MVSTMKTVEVRVASPCTVDWQSMTPADRGRFCGECKKVVHDLSNLTEGEARALLREAGNGELCVRYVYDRDGRVVLAPEPGARLVPASLLHRAKRLSLAAIAPLALAACSSHEDHTQVQGGIMYAPEDAGDATPDAAADGGTEASRGDAGEPDASRADALGPDAGVLP